MRESDLRAILHDLRRQSGEARELGSENGDPKLDWVEGTYRLLTHPHLLRQVEAEAGAILARGIRHVIWAGMGGSVMAVRVLVDSGVFDGSGITIYPLDSADPVALNAIVRSLAAAHGVEPESLRPEDLRILLADVLAIGVAMGMTSEEPITHLQWFAGLLDVAGLPPAEHLMVMAIPGSMLDTFARAADVPVLPIQPDGRNGTGGRMSAPTTRVFLLPAALALGGDGLLPLLTQAWRLHDLEYAARHPLQHPFIRLAVRLAEAARVGVVAMLLPPSTDTLFPWIEQLMEESLGKAGRGVLVFHDDLPRDLPLAGDRAVVRVDPRRLQPPASQPESGPPQSRLDRLAALAATFLGWQQTMAVYGMLLRIPFAGQPAVEAYKSRARELRSQPNPIDAVRAIGRSIEMQGAVLLCPPTSTVHSAEATLAEALRSDSCRYLDVTVNGEAGEGERESLERASRRLAAALRLPHRLRRAPAAYHASEQSEMDGPEGVVSLRLVARHHETVLIGSYDDRFLLAQAAGTWQAMVEAGRCCFLLVSEGDTPDAVRQAASLLEAALDSV